MATVSPLSSPLHWSKLLLLPLVLLFARHGQSGSVVYGGDVSIARAVPASRWAQLYSYFGQSVQYHPGDSSPMPISAFIDSVQLIHLAQGVYRVHLNNPLPSASDGRPMETRHRTSVWRSRTFTNASQPYVNVNIKPWYNDTIVLRIAVNNGSLTNYSCLEYFATSCKPMVIQTAEQRAATCTSDSALVRVGYSGGIGVKSILWSNGATTKRTYADQGETLTVTVTDATGCSMSDSITASTLAPTPVPGNFW